MKRLTISSCLLACWGGVSCAFAATPLPIDRPTPPPCAADGTCYPNKGSFGWYQCRWRKWPGEELQPTPAGVQPTPAEVQKGTDLNPFEAPSAEHEDTQGLLQRRKPKAVQPQRPRARRRLRLRVQRRLARFPTRVRRRQHRLAHRNPGPPRVEVIRLRAINRPINLFLRRRTVHGSPPATPILPPLCRGKQLRQHAGRRWPMFHQAALGERPPVLRSGRRRRSATGCPVGIPQCGAISRRSSSCEQIMRIVPVGRISRVERPWDRRLLDTSRA